MTTATKTEKRPRLDRFKTREGDIDWYVLVGPEEPSGSPKHPLSLSDLPQEYVEQHTRRRI